MNEWLNECPIDDGAIHNIVACAMSANIQQICNMQIGNAGYRCVKSVFTLKIIENVHGRVQNKQIASSGDNL